MSERFSKPERKFGAIVLMDALGTKEKWKSDRSHDRILSDLMMMIDSAEKYSRNLNSDLKNDNKTKNINFKSFSDTVVFTVTTDNISSNLILASNLAGQLLSMGCKNNFFFRGCISYGEFYEDSEIIAGNALNEAGEYFDLPNWIGVSLTPSAYESFHTISENDREKCHLIKYDIPLKIGLEKNGYAVNFLHYFEESRSHVSKIYDDARIERNVETLESEPFFDYNITLPKILQDEQYKRTNISEIVKYRNTLAFLESISL